MCEFGAKVKHLFHLDKELVYLNHGSFGTVPKDVMKSLFDYLYEQETCPEIWFREGYFVHINKSRVTIAGLINASVDDVVLVENASSAVNSLLRSLPLKEGDGVLIYSSAYQMVIDTLKFLELHAGIRIIVVNHLYPIENEEQIVDGLANAFIDNKNIKLCVFSHISSMPTMVKPIKALTEIAKRNGSMVLIDGAHAPGAVDIDVHAIGADFYTGLSTLLCFHNEGSAFLWTSPEYQCANYPQPAVISSSCKYDYVGRFEYTGTRDYTAMATITNAVQYIDSCFGGLPRVQKYCRDLVLEGSRFLAKEWGTGLLVAEELTAFMVNVILPCSDWAKVEAMQIRLMKKDRVSIACRYVDATASRERICYVRVSGQIYVTMEDFKVLAEKVKQHLMLE